MCASGRRARFAEAAFLHLSEVNEMRQVGGVTAWYCPSCGAAVRVGGSCTSCGGGGIPEGPEVYQDVGFLSGVKRAVAKLFGPRG
jgi:hypothetical protein